MRIVVLVCGPPCAGKTTYVMRWRSPGDTVIDLDLIAQELGSTSTHDHDPPLLEAASVERAKRESSIAGDRRTWVVRTASSAYRSGIIRSLCPTEVVVLDPGREVCHQRADDDGRDRWTHILIDQWYDETAESNTLKVSRGISRHPGIRQ